MISSCDHILNKVVELSKKHDLSLKGAREIKMKLSQINDIEILGPIDSPLLKIRKHYRSRLLIRFSMKKLMQKKITNLLNKLKISSKIKLTVDVDPVNFA